MSDQLEMALVVMILIVGSIVMIVFPLIFGLRKQKYKEQAYVTRSMQATVVDQYCAVKTFGYKTPETVRLFTVVFQTDEGLRKFNIPEEMYFGFAEGMTGTLTIAGEDLYSFIPDEQA